MKKTALLLLSVFIFSCQQKENKTVSPEVPKPVMEKKIKEENKQTGDTIFMNFGDEKGYLTAEGVIDSLHPRVYVKFKNEDLSQLKAKIIPDGGKGNIRFNQIIFPDKNSDGPFGMDLNIRLEQKGNHVLVIGHSQMADNPFYGKFRVELDNKKG